MPCHSRDDLFRQTVPGRDRLGASGLGNVVGFGDDIAAASGAVLLFIFLVRKEGVPLFAAADGPPRLLPFFKGAGVCDLRVLLIENQQIPGALRGTLGYEVQEAFQGSIVLKHCLRLVIHLRPQFFALRLFQSGVFFLGQPVFLRLGFLFPANQLG